MRTAASAASAAPVRPAAPRARRRSGCAPCRSPLPAADRVDHFVEVSLRGGHQPRSPRRRSGASAGSTLEGERLSAMRRLRSCAAAPLPRRRRGAVRRRAWHGGAVAETRHRRAGGHRGRRRRAAAARVHPRDRPRADRRRRGGARRQGGRGGAALPRGGGARTRPQRPQRAQLVDRADARARADDDADRPEQLYARARALGLDRTDLVVRRILVQKMRLLAARTDEHAPSDDELRAFYARTPRRISPAGARELLARVLPRRRTALRRAHARRCSPTLRDDGAAPAEAVRRGDPFAAPRTVCGSRRRRSGEARSARSSPEAVAAAPSPQHGSGPSRRPTARTWSGSKRATRARRRALETVRGRVLERWQDEQRTRRLAALLRTLARRYPARRIGRVATIGAHRDASVAARDRRSRSRSRASAALARTAWIRRSLSLRRDGPGMFEVDVARPALALPGADVRPLLPARCRQVGTSTGGVDGGDRDAPLDRRLRTGRPRGRDDRHRGSRAARRSTRCCASSARTADDPGGAEPAQPDRSSFPHDPAAGTSCAATWRSASSTSSRGPDHLLFVFGLLLLLVSTTAAAGADDHRLHPRPQHHAVGRGAAAWRRAVAPRRGADRRQRAGARRRAGARQLTGRRCCAASPGLMALRVRPAARLRVRGRARRGRAAAGRHPARARVVQRRHRARAARVRRHGARRGRARRRAGCRRCAPRAHRPAVYAMGILAAFWCFERVAIWLG